MNKLYILVLIIVGALLIKTNYLSALENNSYPFSEPNEHVSMPSDTTNIIDPLEQLAIINDSISDSQLETMLEQEIPELSLFKRLNTFTEQCEQLQNNASQAAGIYPVLEIENQFQPLKQELNSLAQLIPQEYATREANILYNALNNALSACNATEATIAAQKNDHFASAYPMFRQKFTDNQYENEVLGNLMEHLRRALIHIPVNNQKLRRKYGQLQQGIELQRNANLQAPAAAATTQNHRNFRRIQRALFANAEEDLQQPILHNNNNNNNPPFMPPSPTYDGE